MGFDISGSLAVGMEVPKSLIDLAGPFGGLYKDIEQSAQFLATGQPYRAVEKVSPRAGENILAGIRESQHGAVTGKGFPVLDEKGMQYDPSKGETVWKLLGFRGSRRAAVQEREWEAKRVESRYSDEMNKIYQEYRSLVNKGASKEQFAKLYERVDDFNKKITERKLSGTIPYITNTQLRRQEKRMNTPTKRELMRRQQ
jgi:hypothetical protein